ncbi:MAG: glycosyltransferase [Pyrinomonadaceae bacterium]|nr:glycosyltransferase [Pyrinomonadaceae bacterium]
MSFLRRIQGRKSKVHSLETPTLAAIDFHAFEDHPALHQAAAARDSVVIKTSIIIPVFNKSEFTFRCLRSLLGEIDFEENEVIVVDNASTDETPRLLSRFSNFVRVIRNEENRGFVDACNQGAAAARGKYLVFLNNDTEVLSGWLQQLLETIERDPGVGAVGSMFLYPDGSIQEAGSIVWQRGEAHHYGWGGSPDDLRFNFAREVDYCSAASLLISSNLFQELGGFDRRYAPAYYEDVDLCFGVRSLGFKVIYQPMSRVVHYEGATAGRDVNRDMKQYQIVNRAKFFDKWRDVLEQDHFPRDLKRVDKAVHKKLGPTILVFDERIPSPDRDAGSARMFMILKALRRRYHVVFVPFNRPRGIEYEQALWKEGIETANAVDYRRLLKTRDVRAAIVSRPTIAEAMISRIRRVNQSVAVVFDMVDAHFIRLDRESAISTDKETKRAALHYRDLETRLAQASDLIWCNSSEDRRVMESEVGGKRFEVIPTIHALHGRGKSFADRRHLLFVGNFAHTPNRDGVHFFMREIFPLLERSLPDAHIFIVGDNAPPEVLAYASDRVNVTGYLPDLEPLWHSCRVFIAPLRFGAGVKGKVGEAMSYALPVVVTSIGAEGFGLRHAFSAMIADAPEDFAASIVQLYSEAELWEKLAGNSHRHVEENFTPAVIGETINNSISETARVRRQK